MYPRNPRRETYSPAAGLTREQMKNRLFPCPKFTAVGCENNGICFHNFITQEPFCICPPPYYGDRCEYTAKAAGFAKTTAAATTVPNVINSPIVRDLIDRVLDRALTIIAIVIMVVIVAGILILSWYLARRRRLDLERWKGRKRKRCRNKGTQVNRGAGRQKSSKKTVSVAIGDDEPQFTSIFGETAGETFPLLHNHQNHVQHFNRELGAPAPAGAIGASDMGPPDRALSDITPIHQPMSFDSPSASQNHASEVTNPTSPNSLGSPYVSSPPAVVNFPITMDNQNSIKNSRNSSNGSNNNNNNNNAKDNPTYSSAPMSPTYKTQTASYNSQTMPAKTSSVNNNTLYLQQQQLLEKQRQQQEILQQQQQQLQQQQQQLLYYQQRQQQHEQQQQLQLQQQRQQQQQQQQQQLQLQMQQYQHHLHHHPYTPMPHSHVRANSATFSSQLSAPAGFSHSRSHSRSSSISYVDDIGAHPYITPTRIHAPPPTLHCVSVPANSAPRSPIAPFFDDSFLGDIHGPGGLTVASEHDALLAELESREFNYPSLTDCVQLSHPATITCHDHRRPHYRERQDSGSYSDRHLLLGTLQ